MTRTPALMGITLTLVLSACGGLQDPETEDTEVIVAPPTDTETDDLPENCFDLDGDGEQGAGIPFVCDGAGDQVLPIQPFTVKDEVSGAWLDAHICVHASAIGFVDVGNYGFGIDYQDGNAWCDLAFTAEWWTINGLNYSCARPIDVGDVYRTNLGNTDLLECTEDGEVNSGSFTHWANLTDAREDDFVTRNEDGTYALAYYVSDSYIFPGFDDGSGEELTVSVAPSVPTMVRIHRRTDADWAEYEAKLITEQTFYALQRFERELELQVDGASI